MTHIVSSVEEAATTLDYFNGFHDGFIKKLSILPREVLLEPGGDPSWDGIDVEAVFSHSNYQRGTRPAGQLISATFCRVRELSIDVTGQTHDWAIYELCIENASRTLQDGREAPCLRAGLQQSRLVDGIWHRHEDITFTFDRAEFTES